MAVVIPTGMSQRMGEFGTSVGQTFLLAIIVGNYFSFCPVYPVSGFSNPNPLHQLALHRQMAGTIVINTARECFSLHFGCEKNCTPNEK